MSRGQLRWRGQFAKEAARKAGARALKQGAEHILEESRRIVPIEEGTLSRSGSTDVDEGALTAVIAYDTPYAVRQHEDMSLRHNAGRSGKYLERPHRERGDAVVKFIAGEIDRALR